MSGISKPSLMTPEGTVKATSDSMPRLSLEVSFPEASMFCYWDLKVLSICCVDFMSDDIWLEIHKHIYIYIYIYISIYLSIHMYRQISMFVGKPSLQLFLVGPCDPWSGRPGHREPRPHCAFDQRRARDQRPVWLERPPGCDFPVEMDRNYDSLMLLKPGFNWITPALSTLIYIHTHEWER